MIPLENQAYVDNGRMNLTEYTNLFAGTSTYTMMCYHVVGERSTFRQRLALALGAKQNQRPAKYWRVAA